MSKPTHTGVQLLELGSVSQAQGGGKGHLQLGLNGFISSFANMATAGEYDKVYSALGFRTVTQARRLPQPWRQRHPLAGIERVAVVYVPVPSGAPKAVGAQFYTPLPWCVR